MIVEAELPRRYSGRSSVTLFLLLEKLPYRLDSTGMDGTDLAQSPSSCAFPHSQATSRPPFALSENSAICFGGGSGGGTGSLEFGIDIGMADVAGEEVDLYELDLLDIRYRSVEFDSWI